MTGARRNQILDEVFGKQGTITQKLVLHLASGDVELDEADAFQLRNQLAHNWYLGNASRAVEGTITHHFYPTK